MLVCTVPESREASTCVRMMTVRLVAPIPVQKAEVKDFTEKRSSFPLKTWTDVSIGRCSIRETKHKRLSVVVGCTPGEANVFADINVQRRYCREVTTAAFPFRSQKSTISAVVSFTSTEHVL